MSYTSHQISFLKRLLPKVIYTCHSGNSRIFGQVAKRQRQQAATLSFGGSSPSLALIFSVTFLYNPRRFLCMKLLIHKEKREIVDGREFIVAKARQYFVTDLSKDVHTLYGTIPKSDLSGPSGSVIKSDTGKEFVLLDASFIDVYKRLRKLPQTIPLKDIGFIVGETGINSQSVVVDGGLGSGALAAALAHIAKHVTSYEIREDCIKTAESNIKMLGLNNVTIKMKSLYDGIDEKDVDLITLDLPEPWKVIPHAAKSLKVGGFLISYSPSVHQVQDFVNELQKHDNLLYLKTVELIERLWEIEGRRVRPKSTGIGHSGFIVFARKIRA